jgi:hypothetical protein
MSMRIIACSSSKRNSASARASSVLPTPVGPRKMNEPSGRFGSCRPGTRAPNRVGHRNDGLVLADDPIVQPVSIRSSFWISPSIRRLTGMPVHLPTTSAMSSSSTSSFKHALRLLQRGEGRLLILDLLFELGTRPYCSSEAFA